MTSESDSFGLQWHEERNSDGGCAGSHQEDPSPNPIATTASGNPPNDRKRGDGEADDSPAT